MFAQVCRFAAALAMVSVSFAAVAQVIPSSNLPGRERERFTLPVVPLPAVGGAVIAVPGVDAPAGAEKVALILRNIHVDGSTIYIQEPARRTLRRPGRTETTLQAVYELAQRITAKYGATATCCRARSCRRRSSARAAR